MRVEVSGTGTNAVYYLMDDQGNVTGRYIPSRPDLSTVSYQDVLLAQFSQGAGLNVQPGLDAEHWEAEQELAIKIQTDTDEYNDGLLERGNLNADIERARIAAEQAEAAGVREDARLARELQDKLARDRMALDERLAILQNELEEAKLALQEKQWATGLASNPVDVVQYELYKRGGGAATPQGQSGMAVTAPAATPSAAASPQGILQAFQSRAPQVTAQPAPAVSTSIPGSAQTQDILKRFQAPSTRSRQGYGGSPVYGAKSGGEIKMLVGEAVKGKPNPELLEIGKGRIKVTPVKSAQYGGELELPSAHTDQEMQDLMSGITNQPYTLYNPRLGGATGVFGSYIPRPNEMPRRRFLGLDPNQLGVLQSFLSAGIDMGQGHRTAINPEDWFQQMQRSWIPGVNTGTPEYSY